MKKRGAVLVTGASTGIGLACALRFDGAGYRVFATALSEAEGAEVRERASSRLETLILDVRDSNSIQNALHTVSSALGEAGLAALVNNAGILSCAPLELQSTAAARATFEVNVIGQIALTQAFLPLLRVGEGRIINMGSLAGRSALPFTGPYCASKWAFRALNDTWRLELRGQGIRVILIEPGMVKTPIWKGAATAAERFSPDVVERYGAFVAQSREVAALAQQRGVSASRIADVVLRALQAPKPKSRYVIGKEARLLLFVERLPTPLRDYLIARRFSL